ncbi:MAG: cytochrome c oxidase subunit II [Dehalococcoidia bacterium]
MEIAILALLLLLGMPLVTAVIAYLGERPVSAEPARSKLNSDTAARAFIITAGLWVILTVLGAYATLTYDFYPTVNSDKGEEISHAFTVLTVLAVPVAAMVVAVLVYSFLRRSSFDLAEEDGPDYDGKGPFPKGWLLATSALTLAIIIYPGLTTLDKIVDNPDRPDYVIEVEAQKWAWLVTYPDHGINKQPELVLPVDKSVRFDITSIDIVHSFWIPSVLMKIDAVPGHTTSLSFTATEVGEYTSDPLVRVQCAELCGLGHAGMRIPVRIVTQSEFETWVKDHQGSKDGSVLLRSESK